jgi:mRNA interferase RelE/StbE
MSYTLTVKPSAEHEIRGLDAGMIRRIAQKLQQLERDPRPPGARKLRGVPQGYRVRVGDWRILYTIDDEAHEGHIYRIRHRAEAY